MTTILMLFEHQDFLFDVTHHMVIFLLIYPLL